MDFCRHGITEKSGGPWDTDVTKTASGIKNACTRVHQLKVTQIIMTQILWVRDL